MIQKLFLSFVRDVLKSIGIDFFNLSAPEKEKALSGLPFDCSDFAKIENEKEFLELSKQALLELGGEKGVRHKENLLLLAFCKYLSEKIIPLCDQISTKFFIAKADQKNEVLNKVFSEDSSFTMIWKLFLRNASNEELNSLLQDIFHISNPNTQIVIVQSARECSLALKTEIRAKYTDSLVTFQVNTRLMGGILIYQNGKISDSSWLGKVHALKQLTPPRRITCDN